MSATTEGRPGLPVPRLLAWAAAGALLVWLYAPQTASMAAAWLDDPNYSHGFLVPLVSAWLLWRQRRQLRRAADGPAWWGLAVLAAGLALLVVGEYGHEFYLRRISLVPVLWGLALTAWGWALARRAAFATAYLALMVPLPYIVYDAVAFPLRLVAAAIAAWGIRLFGIPVYLEGNIIHLPHNVLNVVDACSGIRSLISLLAVGVVLAYIMLPNRWSKVLVALLVGPVAVLTNAARVTVTGVLAEWVGPEMLEGATHDLVGWAVFMAGFAILWGVTALLARWLAPRGQGGPPAPAEEEAL